MAISLPMTPDGTQSAASKPSSCGGGLLQAVDGGVLAVDVVADLRLGHGPPHLGRGAGDGVGAQVDHRELHVEAPEAEVEGEIVDDLEAPGEEERQAAGRGEPARPRRPRTSRRRHRRPHARTSPGARRPRARPRTRARPARRARTRTRCTRQKARVRDKAGTVPGSSDCSSGENGPASWPPRLTVASTAATTSSARLSASASRTPPMAMARAAPTSTRRRPSRPAWADSTVVSRASSTSVAVNTAPIRAGENPRSARKTGRSASDKPAEARKGPHARPAKNSRPSRVEGSRKRRVHAQARTTHAPADTASRPSVTCPMMFAHAAPRLPSRRRATKSRSRRSRTWCTHREPRRSRKGAAPVPPAPDRRTRASTPMAKAAAHVHDERAVGKR